MNEIVENYVTTQKNESFTKILTHFYQTSINPIIWTHVIATFYFMIKTKSIACK